MSVERLSAALADRYRIERELGSGGMATVYLAQDIKHNRKVAIKVLKPELAAVLGAERFVVEIKTTAALQHPHILPLFDSGVARLSHPERSGPEGHDVEGPQTAPYYVMPYIQGETLRTRLDRETQLGIDEAVRITRDVADALDYAHRHGIIHRDIKPENILLHDGRPMVADFGIALALSAAAGGRMTETGMSLGTPHYMSPEQATADKEISGRSDIYSLGSVLYEMLTGNPPHTGSSAQQIIMKIIAENVEPVTKYRKSVPPNVAAAVAKSLEKLPADRFESAKAFAEALGNASFTTMHAGVAGGGGARSRTGNRWVMAVVGLVLLAGGVGIGALTTRRPPPTPQVVRFPVPVRSGQLLDAQSLGASFALSPDGTRIAYSAIDSGAPSFLLHLRSLDQFTTTTFPGTEDALNVFFSPDGLWIGVLTNKRTLLKVPVNGGPASTLATNADRGVGEPSWGDDHFIYFAIGNVPARVSDGGGAVTMLIDTMKTRVHTTTPTVLPGSRAVLLGVCRESVAAACGASLNLQLLDLTTRSMKVLVPGATRGWYLPSGHLVYSTADGALFAVKFDLKSLTITSAPVGVVNDVRLGGPSNALAKAAFSASGTMAYLAGGNAGRIIVQLDRSGHEEVILSKPGLYRGPRLSPDGRRLVFDDLDAKKAEQLWIHDRASATTRQLTFDGESVRPTWSPDGARVAFSGLRGTTSNTWTAPADGSGPPERASDGRDVRGTSAVSWTRDGKWIVVDGPPSDGKGAGGEDVFAIPTSGTPRTMRPVVASPFDEQSGEVSPDGKWIAFTSNDAGKNQVYIQPFLTPGGRTLISTGSAGEPAWLSNNELAFVNYEADSLVMARLAFGPTITVTRNALFDLRPYLKGSASARNYDVSRDGTHFIFVKPVVGAAAAEPIVVLNWIEEVKRLMAAAGIK